MNKNFKNWYGGKLAEPETAAFNLFSGGCRTKDIPEIVAERNLNEKDSEMLDRLFAIFKQAEQESREPVWYAVQKDRQDDWGLGSYMLDHAIDIMMSSGGYYNLVAVIEEGCCIAEVTREEIKRNRGNG